MRAGDITWFSPNWYQTHQLENQTTDFCCTIQGFQYADDDDVHYPYMEYKGASNSKHNFLPVSDFVFAEMREALLAEYEAAVGPPANLPVPTLSEAPAQSPLVAAPNRSCAASPAPSGSIAPSFTDLSGTPTCTDKTKVACSPVVTIAKKPRLNSALPDYGAFPDALSPGTCGQPLASDGGPNALSRDTDILTEL